MNQDVNSSRELFWKEGVRHMEGKWIVAAEKRMNMEGWHRERLKCKEFGRSILRTFII